MTDIRALADEQKRRTEWQQTPRLFEPPEYGDMIAQAIRHLYVLTGRSAQFDDLQFSFDGNVPIGFSGDLPPDEREFVLVAAELAFFRKVRTDVDRIVGYSTGALSVTNADKPYANLSHMIAELENRQRVLYYKMARYNLL